MPIFAPYNFESGSVTTENNDRLFRIIKSLSTKIDHDNLSDCSLSGLTNNIINFINITKEIASRKLSLNEEETFNELKDDYQDLLLNFELFCACKVKTRSEFTKFIGRK